MKKVKKLVALVLSIAIIMCSTLPSLATGNDVEQTYTSKIVEQLKEDLGEEKATEILNSDSESLSGENESSTTIVSSKKQDDSIVEGSDGDESIGEGDSGSENVEEPEEDPTETISEASQDTINENEPLNGENESSTTVESCEQDESIVEGSDSEESINESGSGYENVEKLEENLIENSTEISQTNSKEINTKDIAIESLNYENNENIATFSNIEIVNGESLFPLEEIDIDNLDLFGAGEYWCYWYMDNSNPDDITVHYSSTIPTGYDSSDYENFGRTNSTTEAPQVYYRTNIKTAIFDNTINAKSCVNWFRGFPSLENIIDLSYLNTSSVTNMNSMFYQCPSLTSIDCSNFNTSNVTNMVGMFLGCTNLTNLDLSSFNTNNVTNMDSMFWECNNLTSVDLSSFNTSNVTSMRTMFYHCNSLISLNLSNFNTNNVILILVMLLVWILCLLDAVHLQV